MNTLFKTFCFRVFSLGHKFIAKPIKYNIINLMEYQFKY